MPGINDFLPFGTAAGANVATQPSYSTASYRSIGFSSGIAQSSQLNKVWRQSSAIASAIAQIAVDAGQNVLDDGNAAALSAALRTGLASLGDDAVLFYSASAVLPISGKSTVVFVTAASGSVNLTLPPAALAAGGKAVTYTVVKVTGSFAVTVSSSAGDLPIAYNTQPQVDYANTYISGSNNQWFNTNASISTQLTSLQKVLSPLNIAQPSINFEAFTTSANNNQALTLANITNVSGIASGATTLTVGFAGTYLLEVNQAQSSSPLILVDNGDGTTSSAPAILTKFDSIPVLVNGGPINRNLPVYFLASQVGIGGALCARMRLNAFDQVSFRAPSSGTGSALIGATLTMLN